MASYSFQNPIPRNPSWIEADSDHAFMDHRFLVENYPGKISVIERVRFHTTLQKVTFDALIVPAFAAIAKNPTEINILNFVQSFGFLGIQVILKSIEMREGEPLTRWQQEAFDVHYVLTVFEALKEPDAPNMDVLEQFFRWEKLFHEPEPVFATHSSDAFKDTRGDFEPPDMKMVPLNGLGVSIQQGDLVMAAKVFLALEIKNHLRDAMRYYPSKNPTQYRPLKPLVVLDGEWDDKTQSFKSIFRPSSLLGMIWTIIAEAVEGRVSFLKCQRCENWFKPEGKSRGQKPRWCSNACKVANSLEKNGKRNPRKLFP